MENEPWVDDLPMPTYAFHGHLAIVLFKVLPFSSSPKNLHRCFSAAVQCWSGLFQE